MKKVLLVSHSTDHFTIDRVAENLRENKIKTIRLNTDLFPEEIKISERVDKTGSSIIVKTETAQFDTKEIGSVWHRKIWKPIIKTPMEEKYLNASIKESTAVRTVLFNSLQDLPWLDSIPQVVKASDKFYQLRVAQSVGLTIPQTIISNDPKEVKVFYKSLKNGMVAKLHTALSTSMKGDVFSFYTMQIQEEDLVDLDMLELCPMIFQELISKAYELRIAYIDGQCFAGKIASGDAIDWRKPTVRFSWEPYQMNTGLQNKITAFMQKIGLSFGAIDFIAQPDGTYVFLEVNPVGEWGMLEKELDLPISLLLIVKKMNALIM